MMDKLVSVVVPVFNEEQNVPILGARIAEVLDGLPGYGFECLFVNDGSTDGTRRELDKLRAADGRFRPVHLARNSGQSAALVAGMRRSRGAYILTLDGDLQNDPADFPRLLELLAEHDCVCGYRPDRHDNFIRRLTSYGGNRARRWFVDDGIRDSGCGIKGFRRVCLEHIVPFNGVHRFFAAMMRNGGMSVVECPVAHHPRIHGKSKYGVFNRLFRVLYDFFGVQWLRRRYLVVEIEEEAQAPLVAPGTLEPEGPALRREQAVESRPLAGEQ